MSTPLNNSAPRVTSRAPRRRTLGVAATTAAIALLTVPNAASADSYGSYKAQPAKPLKGAIVGGNEIQVTSAPHQVAVLGAAGTLCGGSIVDATHVVSAAHCFFDTVTNAQVPAGQFTIRSGTSNLLGAEPGDDIQNRTATAVAIHPNYVSPPGGRGTLEQFANDVAVITVAPGFDLARGTAASRPIGLPAGGANPAGGVSTFVSGYGLQTDPAGNPLAQPDGNLYGLTTATIDGAATAGGSGPLNAIFVTTQSANGSFCQGDSGGGLVKDGVLLGIVSNNGGCGANEPVAYTSVSAQENLQFIRNAVGGTNTPIPLAPRGGEDVTLFGSLTPQVGDTFECRPGTWTNSPTFTYAFTDTRTGTVFADGPSPTYTLVAADAGRTVSCRATATTAGGVANTGPTRATPAVQAAPTPPPTPTPAPTPTPKPSPTPAPAPTPTPAPDAAKLAVSAARGSATVRPGRTVSIKLSVRNSGDVAAARLRTCVRISSRFSVVSRGGGSLSGGRLCWSNASLSSSTTKQFSLRADRDAKAGTVSQQITASANGVRTASTSLRLTIQRGAVAPRPGGVTG